MRVNSPRPVVAAVLVAAISCGGTDPELALRFARACAEQAAAAGDGTGVIAGSDGWYFAAADVAPLGRTSPTGSAGARAALAAATRELAAAGVDLLVVPVPPKGIVYPDRLAPDLGVPIPVPRLDAGLQQTYADLRADGVRLLDLTDTFLDDRFHAEGPLYCRQDSHWSGVGCVVAGEAIAAAIDVDRLGPDIVESGYGLSWFTTPIRGDLWRRLGAAAPPPEELRLRGIVQSSGRRRVPVPTVDDAAVVLAGDTHTLVYHAGDPHHARGAGLADQIAFELQRPVTLRAAAEPSSASRWQVPPLGANTRIIVWVVGAARLLEAP